MNKKFIDHFKTKLINGELPPPINFLIVLQKIIDPSRYIYLCGTEKDKKVELYKFVSIFHCNKKVFNKTNLALEDAAEQLVSFVNRKIHKKKEQYKIIQEVFECDTELIMYYRTLQRVKPASVNFITKQIKKTKVLFQVQTRLDLIMGDINEN